MKLIRAQEATITKRYAYPRMVRTEDLDLFTRLKARFARVRVDENHYLGYCTIHRAYFIDVEHTKGVIRCPRCDQRWLLEQGIIGPYVAFCPNIMEDRGWTKP